MTVNLKGRSFLTLMDFSSEEIRYMLDLAKELKKKKKSGVRDELLKGKNIVLLFEKTSTRTRCSFEVACHDEGAHVTYLDSRGSQMGKKESLEDTAKVLGRFFDGIEYRGYEQSVVEKLAECSGVPVWNGLTDVDHPTQILADMLTIEEHISKPLNEVKVVFCGDIRNNMSYAWMYGCAKMGMSFVAYGPDVLAAQMDGKVMEEVKATARKTGAKIEVSSSPECLKGADVIYTDVWASMGQEGEAEKRRQVFAGKYQINAALMGAAKKDAMVLHCLPAHRGEEITEEVFEGHAASIFDEAENRLHAQKAVLVKLLGSKA